MGFSNQERINLTSKVLIGGATDANSVGQYYESRFFAGRVQDARQVWSELALIEQNPAGNLAQARLNAAGPLVSVLQDLSQPASAIRLSEVVGTNGSTYAAYSVYNDFSSARLINWLQPQQSPQANGFPSIGYAIRVFDGDPNAGGTEVFTTDGTTGTGINKSVGWFWDYANGLLLLSDDFKGSVSDPYVLGFRYIGQTSVFTPKFIGSVSGQYTCPATVSVNDVVFFSGADQVDRADKSDPAKLPAIGIVSEKPTATTATVIYYGEVSGFAGLTPAKKYYVDALGAVSSSPSAVPGDTVQIIGIAINATTLLVSFNFQLFLGP